ncbi:MAG: Coenzyme F420 hydrogenase/dehydrogenase, beta subunit C-terminal domain [Moorellales bacterium]
MPETLTGGPGRLQEEVLAPGECVACGLCAALCPYISYAGDRVRVVYPCGRMEGACYAVCPRVRRQPGVPDRSVEPTAERSEAELGPYRALWWARATETARAAAAQYGGTVTALLALALARGWAGGAVVVGSDGHGRPRPKLVTEPEAVRACAGSRYVAVPSLAVLAEARRQGIERVAVVGRPCQVQALRRWQGRAQDAGERHWLPEPAVTVGLFCFWALREEFLDYLEERVSEPIVKVDIPPEEVVVYTATGSTRLPLAAARPFIRPGCHTCADPTAEAADVSVGATEVDPRWNTLIVRTAQGQELVQAAVAEGWLELVPYPGERLPVLRQAVANKKRRVADLEAGGSSVPATR